MSNILVIFTYKLKLKKDMLIFTIIIFGMATIRTITPFTTKRPYKSGSEFIVHLLVCLPMIICYIWFLKQFIVS